MGDLHIEGKILESSSQVYGDEGLSNTYSTKNLRSRNFSNKILLNTDFTRSDLQNADFQFTELAQSKFSHANIKNADFQFAHLESCDFSEAKNITDTQFAGANLSFANFPENFEFQSLHQIQELARSLWINLITLLAFCLYSWIAIGSTTDLDLLNDTKSIFVPLLEMSLPTVGFFYLTPLIVLGMSLAFYFQLSLYWRRLSSLPSNFPDGSCITLKTFPTLIDNLIEEYFPYIETSSGPNHKIKLYLTIVVLFFATPVTLIAYWYHFLPRHDLMGSTVHIAAFVVCLVTGFIAWYNIKCTANPKARVRIPIRRLCALTLLVSGFLWGISYAVSNGKRLPVNGFYLDVSFMDLSTTIGNAAVRRRSMTEEQNLSGFIVDEHNLRHANFYKVAFQGGSLKETRLEFANLRKANLNNTYLENAHLAHAKMEQTSLNHVLGIGADFTGADMQKSTLDESVFSQANFNHATMTWAQMNNVKFDRSNFIGAKLDAVVAENSDFQMALLTGASLNKAKLNHSNFYLVEAQNSNLWKGELNNAKLILSDFSQAQLTDASLISANLAQSTFIKATLNNAILDDANLTSAKLNQSKFRHASLKNADLNNAQLGHADFSYADFSGANLAGAWLEQTNLKGADLVSSKGLTRVQIMQANIDSTTRLPAGLQVCLEGPQCS